MTSIVTGAAGFIGSALCAELVARGESVVGIDSFTDYYDTALKEENLKKIPAENFTFIKGDLNHIDLDELMNCQPDVIYHQAGQPGVRKSWGSEFDSYITQNISASQRLLEAATRAKSIKRIVYASSSSVYGDAERYPTTELDRPQPMSPYGVTKLAAENLFTLYAKNFSVPTTSLRYFTVYGPGQRPDMAFTRFTQAAATGGPIKIFGTGEQIRDFTYISDIVEANILAGNADLEPGIVLNISGGSSISVNDTLDIISNISGKKLNISRESSVNGDVFRTGGCPVKTREALGWTPKVSIEDGLKHHYAWSAARFPEHT